MTVTRGDGEGIMRGRVFRNYYEGHIDRTGWGEDGSKGGRWVWLEGGVVGGKCRQR